MTILSSDFCFGIIVDYLCLKPIFHIPLEINWQVHKQESNIKRSNQYLYSNLYAAISLNIILWHIGFLLELKAFRWNLNWHWERLQKNIWKNQFERKILWKSSTENAEYLHKLHLSMLFLWCQLKKKRIIILKKDVLWKRNSSNVIKIFWFTLFMPKVLCQKEVWQICIKLGKH